MKFKHSIEEVTIDDLVKIFEMGCEENDITFNIQVTSFSSKTLLKKSKFKNTLEKFADVLIKGGTILLYAENNDNELISDKMLNIDILKEKLSEFINMDIDGYNVYMDIINNYDTIYTWNYFFQYIIFGKIVFYYE